MNPQVDRLLTQLEESSFSAGVSIAEHMRTVASNGRESSTVDAMQTEAEALRDTATELVRNIRKIKNDG